MSYCGTALYKCNMSRERANRVASIVKSDDLTTLAQSDVYWDEIIDLTSDEICEVYDLTVEGLHNFVAGNIVAHNSIENEADVVMFIYRDEVYNPATERKNQADIVVAKHRNGPVGEVALYCNQAQSRFGNLDVALLENGEALVFAAEDGEEEALPGEEMAFPPDEDRPGGNA